MATAPRNAFSPMRAIRNLVLIEAPGKLNALTFALKRAGLEDFHLLATQGHIMDYPTDLRNLGIDRTLQEPGRKVVKPQIVETIRQWAERAERVLIATDADQEGDVLAQDLVDQVIQGHTNVQRVRLRALDPAGIASAFSNPEPVQARDAWPGAARRIMDRLIGAAFSNVNEVVRSDISVGRVQSGLLGAAAAQALPLGRVTLALPAQDSRSPFVATVDVFPNNRDHAKDLLEKCKRFAEEGGKIATGQTEPAPALKPWCYGEGVLAIAAATGRSIQDVATSMQRLYEDGRMSYPRSGANAITPDALGKIDRVADRHGVRFDGTRVAQFTRQTRHAHESPHPLSADVDLSSPLLLLSQDEAVLSMLARHLVACGQPHVFHKPDPASMPEWVNAARLDFKRKSSLWMTPWPRRKAETGFKDLGAEEHALGLLLTHGLGRPSTQVGHAVKFSAREMFTAEMVLSGRARAWIAGTPSVLLDPAVSARMEQLINDCAESGSEMPHPSVMVRGLLEGLGLWQRIESTVGRGLEHKSRLDAGDLR